MISKTASPPARQHTTRPQRERGGPRLFSTKNDLPSEARSGLVDLLNRRLADSIDLQTQCKQAHWNVKGPSFIGLHKLFDDINSDVEEYVDLLAERIVQLGGVAEGTARCAAERSSLAEYPMSISTGEDHVEALSTALATFGNTCRQAIGEADEMGDADTADILTEISRGIDKWLWFVEAHQQGEQGENG
jgi:starvation-inducible DNA-binding protein